MKRLLGLVAVTIVLCVLVTATAAGQDLTTRLSQFLYQVLANIELSSSAADSLNFGAAGIRITHDADGAVTILGLGDGNDEDITVNFDDTANTIAVSSSTGVTTYTLTGVTTINIGAAGVRVTQDEDGAITFLGLGAGNDEDLTLNLDDGTANTVAFSSSTGVTQVNFTSIGLEPTYVAYTSQSATVDGATTFAATSSYIILACTGAETINTITGGVTGMAVWIEHTDTECTIADDDAPTATNAVDLTGTATNDVGAANKMITLLFNGTYWMQVSESDN